MTVGVPITDAPPVSSTSEEGRHREGTVSKASSLCTCVSEERGVGRVRTQKRYLCCHTLRT